MDSIIVTKLNEITLKSGFLKIETSKGDLLLDIKQMMKEPVNSENAYFRYFNKRSRTCDTFA